MKSMTILIVLTAWLNPMAQAPTIAEKGAPSRITIAAKEEPGERLIVAGRVFSTDGVTGMAAASVYVYHTDVKGYYTPGANDNRNPRLRGYMRTDAQGRYEFSTIKPGSYPNNSVPAHIHYVVTAAGYNERVFEIVFEGDPFLNDRVRREAANEWSGFSLRRLEKDQQGVWRCTQDIKLRR
ncbi:MAG TPA: protocatechuate 3,4-dioxygenase [Blastocatellia bacterium]|nr:protocatechuate 3,4-dioxygenase [Blastocatellia bacterium]